jgi:hypothetical protein
VSEQYNRVLHLEADRRLSLKVVIAAPVVGYVDAISSVISSIAAIESLDNIGNYKYL